jgi:hypothetical protein
MQKISGTAPRAARARLVVRTNFGQSADGSRARKIFCTKHGISIPSRVSQLWGGVWDAKMKSESVQDALAGACVVIAMVAMWWGFKIVP